ncbi:hypothetical protein B0J18DRAFT_251413 [Chaetomium sp. MPI-SDFR-AT-0129]|nr:hypothetical protein B0J18DRAFT_251413 [Chaetomium sp. MPI-SDFR-AT-0129]
MALDAGPAPALPVPIAGLVKHLSQHSDTPIGELLEPYRKHEAHVRQLFAQDPGNELLKDHHANVLPLFTEDTPSIKIRARNLAAESALEKSKYIMPLSAAVRRPNGSPAVVPNLKEFQRNFSVFSESSLAELDWSNVVAAGSSVVNTLLPVPAEYNSSKRGLREFYHQKFSPASDVDLFLYGLTEKEAIEKIKNIETKVRDSLLTETTVVRTKHAITICSQYPTRHIQIVLRIYKSVSEILTGFDIDCSGAAYDGKQVYCTPRALQSYITQINHIDLSRRSPSYENRLSKYSHRGFEVYWPEFDRSRIDPTIFERSFQRTLGLARLLILERLPTPSARDTYQDKRRDERGRPPINRYHRQLRALAGNIKEGHEDEVADWLTEDEVSNYHTFTIPYGERFNAKRIEKLCYTRDLLLNAEWNQPDDREVYLHRHPAFFGRVEDVVNDCCGYCPVPVTPEEKEVAEAEEKDFVSGKISFMQDDPGRQEIGSFNPLTDDDWTEMAYVGNTARLCQAIVDEDLEHVTDWLVQEGADPNTRDYTGRTPLHLAAMSSTPAIVRALVDAGARLIARLADGRTALHLAAARGDAEIVKILLDKSAANEAEHEEKEDQRRRGENAMDIDDDGTQSKEETKDADEESDGELINGSDSDDEDGQSMATGSFVKLGKKEIEVLDEIALESEEEEPDFYDINVAAWDRPCSALHFAILTGHVEVVKLLVQEYGADVLLPVKFGKDTGHEAILTLVLALALPVEKAQEMAKTLLSLGATSAQAETNGITAFHRYAQANAQSLLETLWELDPAGTKTAINHIAFSAYDGCEAPLQAAAAQGNLPLVVKLLERGAAPEIDFEAWIKSAKQSPVAEKQLGTFESNQLQYKRTVEQPLIVALRSSNPGIAVPLLERGANPNTVTTQSQYHMSNSWSSSFTGETALDVVDERLTRLRGYKPEGSTSIPEPSLPEGIDTYLDQFEEGTYEHWMVAKEIESRRKRFERDLRPWKKYQNKNTPKTNIPGVEEKREAIAKFIKKLERVKEALLFKGAKTFVKAYPEFKNRAQPRRDYHHSPYRPIELPFKFAISFQNVNDVTDARRSAYLKLFNAALHGDLETIKTLTLGPWDDAKEEAPLKIAVRDQNSNNPFSLAYDRGHLEVAKAVLEIAHAQYVPEEKPKTRYRMEADEEASDYDEDDDEDMDSDDGGHGDDDDDDDAHPRIYSHIVDEQYTIENVGQVSMVVNSRTLPLEMIEWTAPLRKAIEDNDMAKLKFFLDLCEYWTTRKSGENHRGSGYYPFPEYCFRIAVELGRVELLGEIIKRTGAGLPLEHLVKDTGMELKVKPEYYQGLTVYGKKRNDWAQAGRSGARPRAVGTATSPLLLGASVGRIEAVEWFLSDAPLRHYLTFAKSKAARDDEKLKHLARAPGGFDAAISKWLDDQSELVLHAAVSAAPSKGSTELVAYLAKTQPALLEVKSALGVTPLMLAYRLGRLDAARALVNAGADQTTKDYGRNNLFHTALHHDPGLKELKAMLDLLNPGVLASMVKERTKLENDGRTPLHQYLADAVSQRIKSPNEVVQMLKLFADISTETTQQALRMLDGTGDTPLHTILKSEVGTAVLRAILDLDPSLLSYENAVGRTPAEMAHDRYLAVRVRAQPGGKQHYHNPDLVYAPPENFLETAKCEEAREHEDDTAIARNWRLCAAILEHSGQPKRTLVSLNSANLVAKRLGEQRSAIGGRYGFTLGKEVEDDEEAADADDTKDSSSEASAQKAVTTAATEAGTKTKAARRRRTDLVDGKWYSTFGAWAATRKEKKEKKKNGGESSGESSEEEEEEEKVEEEEVDDELLPKCEGCGERHYPRWSAEGGYFARKMAAKDDDDKDVEMTQ